MYVKLLSINELSEIQNLYQNIKDNSVTFWDKNYPSKELINYDIERKGLWGVFDNNILIGVCFAGKRCEDNEDNFTWKEKFNNRGTFARLGVAPNYQNKGVGAFLVNFVINELKKQNFDGIRILVESDNLKAIKLYSKFNFHNCGKTNREGHDYYLLELRLKK